MIKSVFFKLALGILIVSLVHAGSFIYIEENAEKTEKTEKSEELLHRSHHSNTAKRSVVSQPEKRNKYPATASKRPCIPFCQREAFTDFNVNYIYTISYLDQSFSIRTNRQIT